MLSFFRRRAVLPQDIADAERIGREVTGESDLQVVGEMCTYVELEAELSSAQRDVLRWFLAETFDPDGFGETSFLLSSPTVLEIGPRLNFETSWSSTAVTICHTNGLKAVTRIERSRRFGFSKALTAEQQTKVAAGLHDRMVETVYPAALASFETGMKPAAVQVVSLIEDGIEELRRVNKAQGLAMDEQDIVRFYELFVSDLKRNPTDVELFQLAQGNSEHCRHGFFRGAPVVDGKTEPQSLMQIVKEPWRKNPNNSIIAFHDDSSAIRGGNVTDLVPATPGVPSALQIDERVYHPTLTAETHNHPSGVAPYPGGATGGGGRIRDNQAVGRGGMIQASGAAYCVGNLHLDDTHAWENDSQRAPAHLASPLDILIESSNGASDYGNCFGEPLIYGFVRTYGVQTPDGYRSWFKPLMYSVGAGQIDDRHTEKGAPAEGMLIVQVGGPAFRIGMGGGAASSMMAGENAANLDFDSVQRGNPEMEQRMGRVMRACLELGDDNPIVSAHDLGAGGDSNALPEIAYPAGARIDLREIPVGDQSLSVLEIWGNESQERNALLIRPESIDLMQSIAARERAPIAVVGVITGDGRLVLHDAANDVDVVDIPLEPILGDVAAKEVVMNTAVHTHVALDLSGVQVGDALDRVLRLPSVSSKSYLTRKVDSCVTGRVAQQQCVGPNQLPLSDYAVTAQSLFGNSGVALSLGEQPIKGLVSPAAMARMAVSESLLNLVGAKITSIADIRCSANWMWAAKLPGEGAAMLEAAKAMRDIMVELGMAVDGGKDSLSMAVVDQDGEKIKAPGELVIANYAAMPDVRVKVTPDFKAPGNAIVLVDLSGGKARLGGSALAQAYQQVGNDVPDLDDVSLLERAFNAVQKLVTDGLIVACHDRSDGGVVVSLAEMAFAGNVGINVDLASDHDALATLFTEELGLVLETADASVVLAQLSAASVPATLLGTVGEAGGNIRIAHNNAIVVDEPMVDLRATWESTSTKIDRLQANPECVDQEADAIRNVTHAPNWTLTFVPKRTPEDRLTAKNKPKVAVVRDQGSNGDRELAASFYAAGFEVWDITMSDLLEKRATLDGLRGIAFPGGFSYGDVFDAGKAWGGTVRFHPTLASEFAKFYERPDTFSLGVCNGAQLMAVMGWVPQRGVDDREQPRFIRNKSGRFECRFTTVEIAPSPAILFRGMEGSRMGAWVAHGEGQLHVPGGIDSLDTNLMPMRYVDPEGSATEVYPFNPNGSPAGVTGLTSHDGRHLAIMPHPERTTSQLWQWPWLPEAWRDLEVSPWLKMFQNAYDWCLESE